MGSRDKLRALVDSGASKTLVRNDLVSNMELETDENMQSIVGLGENRIRVVGITDVCFEIFGMECSNTVLVVEQESIQYDIILGVDFLRKNGVKLGMSNRRITFKRVDGSSMIVRVNDDGSAVNVMWEKVPVYSKERTKVRKESVSKIPIRFECNFGVKDDTLLYFEPRQNNHSVVSGVF